ncbi:MAG TPA: nitrilase-related carbon-nitrogen hydrolase, partial [Anaerolineae bacterium]|nr:nitrilase-related carbon-nitrogen hydrolase [Anaerolineae bacterium]
MRNTRLGLIQFAASAAKNENLIRAEALLRQAAAAGAQLVCLQELFTTRYFPLSPTDSSYFDLAEPIDGPAVQRIARLARELGIYVLAPIYEEYGVGRFFNSAVLLADDGRAVGVVRKNHIPRV